MILYYVDESGTGLKDPNTPFFVLAATAIPAGSGQAVDGQVAALKRSLVPYAQPEDFEIKGRDIRRGEKLFRAMKWPERAQALVEVAGLIAQLPIQILAVRVDKRDLPVSIDSEAALYRLAFWRLLDLVDADLADAGQPGLLMLDSRSDLHSSVQDRRIVDAYRSWVAARRGQTRLVDLPWFGFSAFYAGLQLADFSAYLLDSMANDPQAKGRDRAMLEAYARLQTKVRLAHVP